MRWMTTWDSRGSPTALGPGNLGTVSLRARLRLARPSARRRGGRRPGARWTSPELPAGGTRTNEPAIRQPRTPVSRGAVAKGEEAPDPHAHDEEHQGDATGRDSSKAVARR